MITLLGAWVFNVALAKAAPAQFNQTCPAPQLCYQLGATRDKCEVSPKARDTFVAIAEKMLAKYDCAEIAAPRAGARKAPAPTLVPAIFLCDTVGPKLAFENTVRMLSKLESPRALKLFGSPDLQKTLDGDMAEQYLEKSKRAAARAK